MKGFKYLLAAGVVTVYIVCPAYRYYVLGTWIGYKILNERSKYRVIRMKPASGKELMAWKQ